MKQAPASAPRRPVPPQALEYLRQCFGNRLSESLPVRRAHGRDESIFDIEPPQVVIFVESAEEVALVAQTAYANNIPLIPFGAGTSLEGHLLAVEGGVSVDMSRMDRIVSINAEDQTATVKACVTREALNQALKDLGLFFPIDPGANATMGGMASTRASGTNAVRYGTMREAVLGMTAVTATGQIIQTGTRARKSSAGYDLTRLLIGSEGTLAFITQLTVRLFPLPESVSAAICTFPSIRSAVQSTIAAVQLGVSLARCELMDVHAVVAANAVERLGLRESPLLLMEFHGSPAGVEEQIETMAGIVAEHGGSEFQWASTPEDRSRLWKARHKMLFSGMTLRPGCRVITTDACVPISRLADCLVETVEQADRSGITYFVVGHVGDGNFHTIYLVDPTNNTELQIAEGLNRDLVERAIQMDGTCSGKHGVGLHKMEFLVKETGAESIEVMRAIKRALDPANIMNPGKIFAP